MKMTFTRSPITHWALLSIIISLLTVAFLPPAHAFNGILNTWRALYAGSLSAANLTNTSLGECALCHGTSTGNWNAYGSALEVLINSGVAAADAMVEVEADDSDMDPTGADNGTEISASTQPGWTDGNNNDIFTSGGGDPIATNQPPPANFMGSLDPVTSQPPMANADGPYNGTVGMPVAFDGSASNDPDGMIIAYDWTFGDGNTGSGPMPTHIYNTSGVFDVTLTVTDDSGDTGTDTTTSTIGVGNLPPIADADGPYGGTVGMPVAFDGSASNDPDGTIIAYYWDFGDGNTGMGATPNHTYSATGTYNVSLTVTDDAGAMDSAGTTASIDPVADVFLSKLQAPKSVRTSTGKTVSKRITPIGDAVILTQDATVVLSAAVSGPVTVVATPASITDSVSAGNGSTRFRFSAEITCDGAGSATIDWTATIDAAQNNEQTNDTLTTSTSVICR